MRDREKFFKKLMELPPEKRREFLTALSTQTSLEGKEELEWIKPRRNNTKLVIGGIMVLFALGALWLPTLFPVKLSWLMWVGSSSDFGSILVSSIFFILALGGITVGLVLFRNGLFSKPEYEGGKYVLDNDLDDILDPTNPISPLNPANPASPLNDDFFDHTNPISSFHDNSISLPDNFFFYDSTSSFDITGES
jgi:hypothetical protein